MAIHTDLPIYAKGRDLLSLAIDVQKQLPRDVKRSLGDLIQSHCVSMLNDMALANATKQAARVKHIEHLLELLRATQVLLRVCFDKKFVSHKLWGSATLLLESIGKQAGGWLKSAYGKAPAA